ncbi:MAG: preprotein translocase subunit SecE [Roseococcus sp.]|nr:preprotein translocase subunit SecE [Roseococcus sp.]
MAEHKTEIELVEVKAEDIMAERKAMYDAFMKAIPWGIGVTAAVLILLYLIWG